MSASDPQVDRHLQLERDRHLSELIELLRIPSVSADPDRRPDLRRAGDWLVAALLRAGAGSAECCETGGHPIVLGRWRSRNALAPTVLVYGHYDVQPADPLDHWTSPPFEPQQRDNRIYARGASDDKGNMLLPVRAAEALAAAGGSPPVNLIFLFEGEEEIGSPNLRGFLEAHREQLRADALLSADGLMHGTDEPSVMLGSKGVLYAELHVHSASEDLASGVHGGLAPNAAFGLSHLLGSMVAPDGTILVAGIGDFPPPTARDRAEALSIPFDDAAYLDAHGLAGFWGEPSYEPVVRNWFRPTLEVAGIWGGFQGEGAKMVIPARAGAKLTCRLPIGLTPERAAELLDAHLRAHSPPGIRFQLEALITDSLPFAIAPDHPAMTVARRALRRAYGREPLHLRTGAALPVAAIAKQVLGLETVMLSWCMPDENIHGPDEFYRLVNFDLGARVWADALNGLAELSARAEPDSSFV